MFPPSRHRTSLLTALQKTGQVFIRRPPGMKGGSGMVRPLGRPMARRDVTVENLRQQSLAHCEARNLSERTLEWDADRTGRFVEGALPERSSLRSSGGQTSKSSPWIGVAKASPPTPFMATPRS